MFKISTSALNQMTFNTDGALEQDVFDHLMTVRPDLSQIYPMGYLCWVIKDSIRLGREHRVDDVAMMRLFVQLRWEIAPGFFKQPQIAACLGDTELTCQERFEQLATEPYADAWLEAQSFDDASEWREGYLGEEP